MHDTAADRAPYARSVDLRQITRGSPAENELTDRDASSEADRGERTFGGIDMFGQRLTAAPSSSLSGLVVTDVRARYASYL
jgi:hypothetical protein